MPDIPTKTFAREFQVDQAFLGGSNFLIDLLQSCPLLRRDLRTRPFQIFDARFERTDLLIYLARRNVLKGLARFGDNAGLVLSLGRACETDHDGKDDDQSRCGPAEHVSLHSDPDAERSSAPI